jgi:hypothetical protein
MPDHEERRRRPGVAAEPRFQQLLRSRGARRYIGSRPTGCEPICAIVHIDSHRRSLAAALRLGGISVTELACHLSPKSLSPMSLPATTLVLTTGRRAIVPGLSSLPLSP